MSKASQEFVKLGPKAQMNTLFRMLERIEAALKPKPRAKRKLPTRPEITD